MLVSHNKFWDLTCHNKFYSLFCCSAVILLCKKWIFRNFIGNKIQNQLVPWQIFIIQNSFLFNSMCLSQFTHKTTTTTDSTPPGWNENAFNFIFVVCFHLLIRFGQLKIRCATQFIVYCWKILNFSWSRVWGGRRFLITLKNQW